MLLFYPSFRLNVTDMTEHTMTQLIGSHVDTVPGDMLTIRILSIPMTYLKKKSVR
jgi:hypothetical protein